MILWIRDSNLSICSLQSSNLSSKCSWGSVECVVGGGMLNNLNPRRFSFNLPSKIAFLPKEYAKIAYPAGWNYKEQNPPGRVVIFDPFLPISAELQYPAGWIYSV